MLITHRVKSSDNKIIGFLDEDNNFYNCQVVRQEVDLLDNIELLMNGEIRCIKCLPEISYSVLMRLRYEKLCKENPIKRGIQKDLSAWKNNECHNVLQLEGMRQVGKTTELLKFAYSNYEYVIYVNLANDIFNFCDIFISSGVDCLAMSRYCIAADLPEYVNSKNTLLIIDEIQEKYEIYNLLKDFNSQLDCDVIVTGSYIGQALKSEYFHSADTVTKLLLTPLSFREFIKVFDKEDISIPNDLNKCLLNNKSSALYEYYNVYKKIGGYPNVVMEFVRTKSIDACKLVLRNLLYVFTAESRKYFKHTKESLIFEYVFREAVINMLENKTGSENKIADETLQLVKNSSELTISKNEVLDAIKWLKYSKLISVCTLSNRGTDDLQEVERMYFTDCGILHIAADDSGISGNDIENLLTETFIFNELIREYSECLTGDE